MISMSKTPTGIFRLRIVAAAMIVVFLSAGCVAHRQVVSAAHSDPELDYAYRDMAEGKYVSAVTRYLLVVQRDQSRPEARQEARFRLGECYYQMHSYVESGLQFQRYLADYPDGAFVSEAKQYLEKLQGIDDQERKQEELQRRQDEAWLKQCREVAGKQPNSADAAVDVGHALWNLGQYEDAAREYLRAVQLDPRKRNDKLVSSRLEFHEDGSATVLTPAERERREKELNPIVIFNKHGYKGGGQDLFDAEPRWYIVTGQVVNRSSRTVGDVSVAVTIYDFSGHVLDTANYGIGAMRPGQIRAFRTTFGNFENIYNVDRYECEAVYQ
jgi:tetratricopeptide (TPR) repeat protein